MSTPALHILVIEDDPEDFEIIRELLAGVDKKKFVLEHAPRLSRGLERLSGGGVDVVLLDLGLPDSQGLKTILEVNEHAPNVPIVVMTGLADEELGNKAVKEGAQDYLVKGQVDANLLTRCLGYAVQRKKVEKEIRWSRTEWEGTFNAMSDWICLIDNDSRIWQSNQAGERFVGLSAEEAVGQSCCKLVHGTEKPVEGCPFQKALETGKRESVELELPDKDLWLMVTVDPVKDEDGEIISAIHIVTDITERRKAEEELRESERTLNVAESVARIGSWKLNPETFELTWSRELYRIFGLTPSADHDQLMV